MSAKFDTAEVKTFKSFIRSRSSALAAKNLYVDYATGNDTTGDGLSWGTCFKTIEKALKSIPAEVEEYYYFINLAEGKQYTGTGVKHYQLLGGAVRVYFIGCWKATPDYSGNIFGKADVADRPQYSIQFNAPGFAPSALKGKFLRKAGSTMFENTKVYPILDNTADTVFVNYDAGTAIFNIGDTWEVTEPGAVISGEDPAAPGTKIGTYPMNFECAGGGSIAFYMCKFEMYSSSNRITCLAGSSPSITFAQCLVDGAAVANNTFDADSMSACVLKDVITLYCRNITKVFGFNVKSIQRPTKPDLVQSEWFLDNSRFEDSSHAGGGISLPANGYVRLRDFEMDGHNRGMYPGGPNVVVYVANYDKGITRFDNIAAEVINGSLTLVVEGRLAGAGNLTVAALGYGSRIFLSAISDITGTNKWGFGGVYKDYADMPYFNLEAGLVLINSSTAKVKYACSEIFLAPAIGATNVHAQIDSATVSPVTGGMTNPDVPRNLQITFGAAWDGGTVTVAGTDAKGATITEDFIVNLGGITLGTKAFATVVSVAYTTGTGGAGKTIDVQLAAAADTVFGVAKKPATDFDKLVVTGVAEAIAASSLSEATFKPTSVPNGVLNYTIWYRHSL